ncbi:MAG: recombinase family protein [Ruminococcaceae bacterium]|nr:recombinase family protein [Oscillospiraceae bacterium]
MPTYAIYLRKSRKDAEAEAHGEGETLARHKRVLLDYAKKNGLHITKIYEEIVSGESIAARPQMQQLLADVEQCFYNGVLVIEVERLARGDTIDQGIVAQAFKLSDTKIITPIKTYDPSNEFDEEYFEFGLFMSRREYKTINRRLQNGRAAAAKEGKYIASIAPYGYEKVKIQGDKGYTLQIIPEQAQVIKNIFDWYVNGFDGKKIGLGGIARRLNDLGVKPCRHDYWGKEALRDIITNPVYIGKIRWGYRKVKKTAVDGKIIKSRPVSLNENCILSEGLHQAIIAQDIFDKAQEILKSSTAPPVNYKKEIRSPLAGLIICSKCGHKMTLRSPTSPDKPPYLVCRYRYCGNVSSPFPLVEKRLLNILGDWTSGYKLKWKENGGSVTRNSGGEMLEKTIAQTKKKINTLEKQLDNMYDLLEQKVYTPEQFSARSASVSKRLDEAKREYRAILDSKQRSADDNPQGEKFIPKIGSILEVYNALDSAAAKNEMLKCIITKAVYSKEKSGAFKGTSADDFTLLLYPKLPKE